jgi:anti-sigma-K factor RskA
MAQSPTTKSVTEDAFLADRQKFWRSFTSFTLGTVITVAVILALLALFLV